MLPWKIFYFRCLEMIFPSFCGHIFSFSAKTFGAFCYLFNCFEHRKVEIISYQTENNTAIFNEILTCNNNALLSELMVFILYTNHYYHHKAVFIFPNPQRFACKMCCEDRQASCDDGNKHNF